MFVWFFFFTFKGVPEFLRDLLFFFNRFYTNDKGDLFEFRVLNSQMLMICKRSCQVLYIDFEFYFSSVLKYAIS